MLPTKSHLLAACALLASVGIVRAQDNAALIDLLVRKGLISDQEAEDVRADLAKEAAAATVSTTKGSYLEKVGISGRIQAQYVNLSTDVDGSSTSIPAANHFFLRRVYLGVKAQLFQGWSGYVNYDFAGSTFDAAALTWKASDQLSLDVGLRKAPIGYDEWLTSSGSIKAIERSAVTRYFVEGNNGRRLGAGSYRQGVFLNGGNLKNGFQYTLAVTNAERDESASGAAGAGNATNNNFAYWAQAGYGAPFSDGNGSWRVGAALGWLPDQGGKTLGAGDDLLVADLFTDVTFGQFSVAAEAYFSNNDNGAGPGLDAHSWGYWIQPSYRFGQYEAVLRFGQVDSDGRGISLSDSLRSAPSGGTMDKLTEVFAGGSYYMRGNDLKLQVGYVWGQSKDTVSGEPAQATSSGVRSQLQLNF